MAIVELGPRVAVVPGGVNIGVLRNGQGQVVLVDTGLNETNGKKVLKAVREEVGGEVVAILTTHAHADHFGANAAVVKRTGARVFAPAFDEAVLRYPLLQPVTLYAGADPPDAMRGGFLLADPSPVDDIVSPGPLEVADIEIEVVSLAGHSFNQVGFLVDGVFFCADVVLPETVLAKYKIPYLFSVTAHLRALETAAAVAFETAVPGHGPIVPSLSPLIELNRALLDDVADQVVEIADEGRTAEDILTALLVHFGANVGDAPGFYLLQPTVFAFLSHLQRVGLIAHEIKDGRSLWRRT